MPAMPQSIIHLFCLCHAGGGIPLILFMEFFIVNFPNPWKSTFKHILFLSVLHVTIKLTSSEPPKSGILFYTAAIQSGSHCIYLKLRVVSSAIGAGVSEF